tara:strand:+ start:109 stop:423 length:315 start_codon:yes stop_codon:yes gene_type:complete
MKYLLMTLALTALVSCGSDETGVDSTQATPACSTGLVVNDFGNCVSDVPYSCGWKRNNPGALREGGASVGDVVKNLKMVDQCGDDVELWDFYGEYNILWMSAMW